MSVCFNFLLKNQIAKLTIRLAHNPRQTAMKMNEQSELTFHKNDLRKASSFMFRIAIIAKGRVHT